jgi:hypothetical protein
MSADETADLDALQLVCPITAELFQDPVLLVEDGYTYERSAVTAWLENNDTSPMSGAALTTKTLAPNIRARQQADAARGGKPPPDAKRHNEVKKIGPAKDVARAATAARATGNVAQRDALFGRRPQFTPSEPPPLPSAPPPPPNAPDDSAPGRVLLTPPQRNRFVPEDSELMRWVRSYGVPNGGPRAPQRAVYDWFDGQENWYRWPLHRAAMRGECRRVAELTVISNRFDANQKMTDWFDSEPLGWAASFGQLDAVRVLIECGADPLRPSNAAGNTPLKDAQREGHAHVVRFLKEYAYRKARPNLRRDANVNAGVLFRGSPDTLGDPYESNFGFVLCPVFGHPDFDKGAYHAPVGCCCVTQNKATVGATDKEACFESVGHLFALPLIVPLYVATCFYKPCGGVCWWGDVPCTEQRVTLQYARNYPCCLTRGAAVDRRRQVGNTDGGGPARDAERETAAVTVAAPPRARMLRAAPRGDYGRVHSNPETRGPALPRI